MYGRGGRAVASELLVNDLCNERTFALLRENASAYARRCVAILPGVAWTDVELVMDTNTAEKAAAKEKIAAERRTKANASFLVRGTRRPAATDVASRVPRGHVNDSRVARRGRRACAR